MASWEARFGIEHDLIGNTMWGDDYPHPEGTWPHTREAMAATFCGIEQKYVRQYLGDVAIDVYNLDRAKLQEVADRIGPTVGQLSEACRSEEHTSELQSLMRISYAVFCLKKKTTYTPDPKTK